MPYHDAVAAALHRRRWITAKTMPDNPQEYPLRKAWKGVAGFDAAVQFIRDHGYKLRLGKRWYVCLDIGEHRYWIMGWPVAQTILINRAVNE